MVYLSVCEFVTLRRYLLIELKIRHLFDCEQISFRQILERQ